MELKQKLYDLKNQKQQAIDKAKALALDGKLESEEYKAQNALIDDLSRQIKAIEDLIEKDELMSRPGQADDLHGLAGQGAPEDKVITGGILNGIKASSVATFAAGVRNVLTEGTAADGGYTVPADIVTRIYELIDDEDNILPFITNTPVTTASGKRTYKTRKQMAGFATAAEAAKIQALEQPTFAQISYTIAKRAGYLPVTEELLEDSDENITAVVMQWIADEARVTINKKVVALATNGSPTEITGLDGILTILTTGLGAALRAISTVHTNDSGLLYLSLLKDKNDRPLLQPDPTQPTRMTLGVGATRVPIKVWDNDTLPNTLAGAIPFIIGSLKEGVERFDRKQITVTRLTEATLGSLNLAEQDMVAFKAVMRDDYQLRDAGAFVYATLTETEPVAPTLSSIAITTPPTKTSYTAGQDFDPAGMVVTATYNDETTKAVTNNVSVLDGSAMAQGKTSVLIAYAEGGTIKTATQAVTVGAAAG